ncbi:MAG TPA: helicase-related protein, partial [Phenylobacterium sp.]|nr:helicase-related protein [Phenylobacterium sp.]
HVFNYDVPHHADDYVHRIGRTGRAGRSGQTFMIVTPADSRNLDKILKLVGGTPTEITLDLDWANIKDEPRAPGRGGRDRAGGRDRGGRERSGRGDRGGRGDRAPRGERPHRDAAPEAEAAAPAPVRAPAAEPPAPREAETEAAPGRRESRPRQERPERPLPPPPVQAERPPRQQGRGGRRDREDGDDVVGFGSDVPAFLNRGPGPRRDS